MPPLPAAFASVYLGCENMISCRRLHFYNASAVVISFGNYTTWSERSAARTAVGPLHSVLGEGEGEGRGRGGGGGGGGRGVGVRRHIPDNRSIGTFAMLCPVVKTDDAHQLLQSSI